MPNGKFMITHSIIGLIKKIFLYESLILSYIVIFLAAVIVKTK